MGPILINCLLFSPESKQKLVEIGYVCPCIVLSGSSPLNYGSTAACIKTRSLWPLCFEAGCGGRLAREADSLPCQGGRDSQVKLGVSGLHCLTALPSHWPPASQSLQLVKLVPQLRTFPQRREGGTGGASPAAGCQAATFLRRKKTLVPHFSRS